MVDSDDPTALGAWAGTDLGATARTNVGVGADHDLPDAVRFLAAVVKLVRRRIAEEGAHADPDCPAIFLLQPNVPTTTPALETKRVPMLDNGLTPVAGRLWFVSTVVVSGRYIEVPDKGDDALFDLVTTWLGLGDIPAIVFDPRTKPPTVRYYPNGLGNADACETREIASGDISLEKIYHAIEGVYQKCLITPDAQQRAGKLWENSEKWWPSSQAEDVIQLYLRAGLTTAFPMCVVRHEQALVPGRLDLELEESDALDRSKVTRHAILELKVLRSFRSSGSVVPIAETNDWIESGVKQAASYRDERGARSAALCCFDMRKKYTEQECFDHVTSLAATLKVELKHWFLFATSKQYRDHVAGGR